MSAIGNEMNSFVTVEIGDQAFGIPIERVREVFQPERVTRVPHAPGDVAGVLNLRGRIVTAIDMRFTLGMTPAVPGDKMMAIGVDHKVEALALIVDRPGDVLDLDHTTFEATPQTLDPRWRRLLKGVHRLEDRLLLILDVDRVLGDENEDIAA